MIRDEHACRFFLIVNCLVFRALVLTIDDFASISCGLKDFVVLLCYLEYDFVDVGLRPVYVSIVIKMLYFDCVCL